MACGELGVTDHRSKTQLKRTVNCSKAPLQANQATKVSLYISLMVASSQ